MSGAGKLDKAEADVALARARLTGTIGEIRARLAPSHLAEEAIDSVKTRSAGLAAAARRRPVATTAWAAGIVLLLARRPIRRLLRRLFSRG